MNISLQTHHLYSTLKRSFHGVSTWNALGVLVGLLAIMAILRKKIHSIKSINKYRSSRPEVFCKKDVLKIPQNSQENTCESFY